MTWIKIIRYENAEGKIKPRFQYLLNPDFPLENLPKRSDYFAYANRTVLGLGVDTKDEIIGLSPNNDAEEGDWQHQ